jgi:DNA mismatch endonuclease (patch repair protein)
MADVHTPEQRSRNMAAIRSKDTKPEMIVRRLTHSLGYRYRLHQNNLPGKPDLVFSSRKKIIFVHGCYWHMHNCRYGKVAPMTNSGFWQQKRSSNVIRDRKNIRELKKKGWDVFVIWECELEKEDIIRRLDRFLKKSHTYE